MIPMKFSVITPVFNGVPLIRGCVGSVRSQYGLKVEHLIHDGGSKDGTTEFLSKFKECIMSNERYHFSFVSESDEGMYDAINRGWERSSGEIFSWLNSDEQYLPGTLKKVANLFSENPDVDVVYGNAIMIDGEGGLISARRELPLSTLFVSNAFLNIFSCTIFFRKKLWDEGLLRLDSGLRYAADMDLILRLLSGGVKMLQVDDYLSLFTADGSNLSTHKGMFDETAYLQNKYGTLPRCLRQSVRLMRYVQRLTHGHYRPTNVQYMYALDELPTYSSMEGVSRGKFSF